ncbi:RNA polymerase sigma-70 factor (ECF subfamily) [Gracilibacillus halotolerans]|uniref:RNA polymerase sigma factor n=1 Tax=Gracilibacillus halotolerans TaxID=74386 RepID=A0A841RL31_9BACI|nr:RNA polymerase sigma factor [Gracilibacillus halotolerans]MBB6513189.1 RNA polymerase sigma-70 factor (ECF subfamily) [Gracilibacillus halotolerans]
MNEELITDWFDAYANDVYRFLIYYTSSADVEDLVQEVFIKAIHHYDHFRGDSSPKTWLFSIARNVAIDQARKNNRKNWRSLIHLYEDNTDPSPEETKITKETVQELYEAIEKLKQSYRDVIILRAIKELSVKETAKILNWTDTKVRVTYHRALNVLKEQLKEVHNEGE